MANFIDEDLNENQETTEDVTELDQTEEEVSNEAPEETVEETTTESVDDDIPEKYRGKSAKDIAKMHMEAEKALGRQGSEVGELRRLVDDYIRAQSVQQKQQAPSDNAVEEDIDFFADPKKAIDAAIQKHPKIREAEMLSQNMRKAEALATLKSQHPDFQNIVGSSEFIDWVGKSKVRAELFARADQRFDFEAANELLTNWKERKQVVEQAKAIEQVERKQAVKAASTGSAKGSAEGKSAKVYRRADIINLMQRDPDRYAALSDEILKAYSEGRVR